MAKSLVIVESPAKAKTINKYLGSGYVVKSSVGHIRDLPTGGSGKSETGTKPTDTKNMSPEQKEAYKKQKAQAQLVRSMGVDPGNGWKANYQILPGKEKVVKELQDWAAKVDTIYLATDLDREGEAIAWHLKEAIGGDESRFKRVVFNEITKSAIKTAFNNPAELDYSRVEAQQARRFLDRVVGYMLSPLLWKKVARGLSAGRVQSVAVRLVVQREHEISAFNPKEYWDIHADFETSGINCRFKVTKKDNKELVLKSKQEADTSVLELKSTRFTVSNIEEKPTSSKPSAPFITSTLQQAASTRIGFGVKKTMMLAQRLYEAGYITYMRTDSTNLSQEAVNGVREYIANNIGNEYLPNEPIVYSSKQGAQEAHEAIRPTDVNVHEGHITGLDPDASRLYGLIWRQFVACQMLPARYLATSVTAKSDNGYELKAKGRVLLFAGWTKVLPPANKKDELPELPKLSTSQALNLKALDPKQHFTKPAPRYTEASLVRELEKRGIGRPSTYASIISTIQDRGYVNLVSKRFYAEKMGDIVSSRLVESFEDLMDYGFTAKMEDDLDKIAEGHSDWKSVLNHFYKGFLGKLELAENDASNGGMRSNLPTPIEINCPACERQMAIRTASTGVFLGCTGYNLPPKERCKETINLVPGSEAISVDIHDLDAETEELREKHRCPKCSTAMDSYLVDEKRKLHICGNNPDCNGFEIESGQFKIKGYDGPVLECDKCSSEMQLKNGRFGKYFDCTNSECKNTRKLLKNGEAAPPKADPIHMPELKCENSDAYFVLRDGASGIFLAAHTFPRSRETRAPLLLEIIPVKDKLDPKYQFLTKGPQKDPDGFPAIVRYSRKKKEQYLMSETDEGKSTGWIARYENGKWIQEYTKGPNKGVISP